MSGQPEDVERTVPLVSQPHAETQPVQQTLAYTPFEHDQADRTDQADTARLARTREITESTKVLAEGDDDQTAGSAASSGQTQLLRFGPGVPAATVPVEAAAVWRGTAQPDRKRRRRTLIGWLVPILVLLVVLAILLWRHASSPLTVTGASVRADPATISCDATATVIGTLQTNGQAGTISYQWKRSDGTMSDVLEQQVTKGAHQVDVSLLWTFNGAGSVHATATLDILSPTSVTAATTFDYTCAK
jgi:hypothetical protein